MSVYKILETEGPGGHERRSRDVGSERTEADENSTSPLWSDHNDSDSNASDYKSKSPAIPAISLIKDFFGNHEKNEELEDITLAKSSHNDWLEVEESFKDTNFSISPQNSLIKSPFLVDTAYTAVGSNKSDDSQDVEDKGGGGGEGDVGVSSTVYAAVHDAVTNLLSKDDIEADLVSKLHHLLGGYIVSQSSCQVDGHLLFQFHFYSRWW